MPKKKSIKPLKLSFRVEGVEAYEQALNETVVAFQGFKVAAMQLQNSIDKLNSIEIKVVNE